MHQPRDDKGRMVSRKCPDLNCGGTYQHEGNGYWRCDGLTHTRADDPLRACDNGHVDGEPV